MRVNCLVQEHNTMSPGRARTRTARSGDERTNHEAKRLPPVAVDGKDGNGLKFEKSSHSFQTLMLRLLKIFKKFIMASPL